MQRSTLKNPRDAGQVLSVRTLAVLLSSVLLVTAGCTGGRESATRQEEKSGVMEQEALKRPAESSFKKVVLVDETTRPNVLEVAPDGRVFFAERDGAVRVWDPATRSTRMVGHLPVQALHTSGLLGMALDPDFEETGWMYLYYSPHDETKNELARFTVEKGRLLPGSKKVLLEVPVQRHVDGGHSAGELEFGPDGHLFLSTGDNTNPRATGYAPLDERPGRQKWDAQRSAANTMDLRGKILRITPQPNGTYTIPEGNLFPYGTRGRPEIYVMGNRNPYRFSVDPATGDLYWGEVGPDAGAPRENRGPQGYDEFNRARRAGNYGWPYFVADNKAYHDYDFAADMSGPTFDPDRPVNDSPNNTGARVLPPAQPALIWYPYGDAEAFPALGSGGRAAMAGPVYRYDAARASPQALPPYFDGRLFIFEFMRSWIKDVKLGEGGAVQEIISFLPDMTFHRPMDMEIGPRGRLYVIEWGRSYEGWYNEDTRIVRLDYYEEGKPPAPARATVETGREDGNVMPRLSIARPVQGGIFDFNAPIEYRLNVSEEEAVAEEELIMQPHLIHDTHAHPLQQRFGRTGSFQVRPDETHLYLENHALLLEARYTDDAARGGVDVLASRDSVLLQPRRKQAEHAASSRGIEREITGDDEGGSVLRVRRNVQVSLAMKDSSHVSYAPVNLLNIHALTLRAAPVAGGTVEVHLDAPDGPLLARREVPAGAGNKSSWRNITLPVEDPGGPHALFLVFYGPGEKTLMKLDWIQFEGQGIMSDARTTSQLLSHP